MSSPVPTRTREREAINKLTEILFAHSARLRELERRAKKHGARLVALERSVFAPGTRKALPSPGRKARD